MYAFDRDGVLTGVLGDFAAGHPKNYQSAEMPLIGSVFRRVPKGSIIISNQAGIDRGYTTLELVQSQFDWLMYHQPNFVGAFFCPDEGSSCYVRTRHMARWAKSTDLDTFRKPDAGMGLLAQEVIGKRITHYVGDLSGNPAYADGRDSDRQFALNLGCEYLDVHDFLAAPKRGRGRPKGSSDYAQLNLRLRKSTIERLKKTALADGYITEIGIHKGEPNISKWLENNA